MSHNQVRNTEYHRRSVPNLLMEINNPTSSSQIYQQPGLNGSNQNITNQTSSSGMNRLYQKQQKKSKSPITIHNRHSSSQPKYQQASRQTFNNTPLSPNPYLSKPPTSKMSTSQSDLKNFVKHSQQKQTSNGHHPHHKLSTSTSNLVPNNNTGNCPVISLNQKCSCCSQMLGQGSAMFIEKLGLAFHLKCFRCSVCNVALGNGKEGTDVRVSVTNRLHCNNCFSNDLGKIYFNFNFIHCDFTSKSLNGELNNKNVNNERKASIKKRNVEDYRTEKLPPKPEMYYKMYKMPLIRNEKSRFCDDSYLIIPNYISSDLTTKRHSSYTSFKTDSFKF